MPKKSHKYDKLRFKIESFQGGKTGVFEWGNTRMEIFDRFQKANKIQNMDLRFDELQAIITEDREFFDAYNSLGWYEWELFNYGSAFNYFFTAYEIGSKLIPKDFDGTINWGFLENRPFLKTMHGLGLTYEFVREYERADQIFDQLLKYNPGDNQGIRALAIETNLLIGNFKKVLRICKMFPDDIMPDTSYGRFVAHYRLGQKEKAATVLKQAIEFSPVVAKELVKKKHKPPKNERPGFITMGGEDEAYDYWYRTRVVWTDPELIDFIKGGIQSK